MKQSLASRTIEPSAEADPVEAVLPLEVLLVEDNPGDAELIGKAFRASSRRVNVRRSGTLEEGARLVEGSKFDLVLLDLSLPDSSGLETVLTMCAHAPSTPIIVLTGLDDEEMATKAVQAGAQDYLVKGQIDTSTLLRAGRYAMDRQALLEKLRAVSCEDDLTGIANRRGFFLLSHQFQKVARRTQRPMLLIAIDIDGFKGINDDFGHQEGDVALVAVAAILKNTFREGDIIARVGGDEFVVLAVDATDEGPILDRLRSHLEAHNASQRKYKLSLSVGTARMDAASTSTVEAMLGEADALMYERKRGKRNALPAEKNGAPSR